MEESKRSAYLILIHMETISGGRNVPKTDSYTSWQPTWQWFCSRAVLSFGAEVPKVSVESKRLIWSKYPWKSLKDYGSSALQKAKARTSFLCSFLICHTGMRSAQAVPLKGREQLKEADD